MLNRLNFKFSCLGNRMWKFFLAAKRQMTWLRGMGDAVNRFLDL